MVASWHPIRPFRHETLAASFERDYGTWDAQDMHRTAVVVLAMSGLAVVGCGSPSASHLPARPPSVGTVTGIASPCTGAAAPAPGRLVTVVLRRLSQADPTERTQTVKSGFVYRFEVPPATYSVTSDQSYAPVRYVTVHIGKTAKLDIYPSCS